MSLFALRYILHYALPPPVREARAPASWDGDRVAFIVQESGNGREITGEPVPRDAKVILTLWEPGDSNRVFTFPSVEDARRVYSTLSQIYGDKLLANYREL